MVINKKLFIENKHIVFLILILLSIITRLGLSQIGYNYDLTSWKLVGEEVLSGRNFYVDYNSYPYGPIFSFLFAGFIFIQKIIGNMSMSFFHFEVVVVLTICDLLVYRLLSRDFGSGRALFFILNPISVCLTGFHSQIEIVAIVIGYYAWNNLLKGKYWLAGMLLGISIGCKHVLLFFPIVLLFADKISLVNKAKVFLSSYFIFLVSIWLYSGNFTDFKIALVDIFSYAGAFGENGIIVKICYFILPSSVLEGLFTLAIYKYIFISLVLLFSFLFIWIDYKKLFIAYFLFIFVFSSSLADQHMILPLMFGVAYATNFYFWIYTILGTIYLTLMSNANIAPYVVENILHGHFTSYHGGWFRLQFWLLLFLLQYYFKESRRVILEGLNNYYIVFLNFSGIMKTPSGLKQG